MARPREFDKTEVLKAVKNVFWEKGFDGTSYPDLIAASGLHKGSLYAAFGDKRSLYLSALQNYDEHEVAGAVALLSGDGRAHKDGKERIAMLFDMVINAVKIEGDSRGCLLCNAAVDQAIHNIDVQKSVTNGMTRMISAFASALRDTQSITSDDEVQKLASHCNAVYFGMRVMAKSGVSTLMLEHARDGALSAIR